MAAMFCALLQAQNWVTAARTPSTVAWSAGVPDGRAMIPPAVIGQSGRAVGVARAYLFAGELGAKLHNPDVEAEDVEPYSEDDTGFREYKVKLCKIKDRILTEEGKRMAEERHAFMEEFFERFQKEYQGKR